MYEDANDLLTLGWHVYDGPVTGVSIKNVYDSDRQKQVIDLSRDGTQGFRLWTGDGMPWHYSSQFVISWRMKSADAFTIYIDVETSAGHRYLQYVPVGYDRLGSAGYVLHGIGSKAVDGQWHRFVRDLQADLTEAQPEVTILEINSFMIRGSGRLDDIALMELNQDSDGDGITNFEEVNTYRTDPDLADTDVDGISDGDELAYWGADWNADYDSDGMINLLDPDSDNDGILDGDE